MSPHMLWTEARKLRSAAETADFFLNRLLSDLAALYEAAAEEPSAEAMPGVLAASCGDHGVMTQGTADNLSTR